MEMRKPREIEIVRSLDANLGASLADGADSGPQSICDPFHRPDFQPRERWHAASSLKWIGSNGAMRAL
jgi:hypothetical protein